MKTLITKSRLVVVLMLIFAALGAVGCNVLLPAHPHSMKIEGERVDIGMLTYSDMQTEYAVVYSNAFGHTPEDIHTNLEKSACLGPKPSTTVVPVFVAPLVAASVGAIVDWTTNQLAQESDRYVAQFGYQAALDGFWSRSQSCKTNLWVPNYYGLSITRTVEPKAAPRSS